MKLIGIYRRWELRNVVCLVNLAIVETNFLDHDAPFSILYTFDRDHRQALRFVNILKGETLTKAEARKLLKRKTK